MAGQTGTSSGPAPAADTGADPAGSAGPVSDQAAEAAFRAVLDLAEDRPFRWELAMMEDLTAAAREAETEIKVKTRPPEPPEAIAYWPFDEAHGTGGAGQTGGLIGEALALGTGVTAPHDPAFALADATLALWFRAAPADHDRPLVTKGTAAEGASFAITLQANGQVAVTLTADGEEHHLITETVMGGGWHHLAVSMGMETGFRVALNGETAAWSAYRGGLESMDDRFVFAGPHDDTDETAASGAIDEAILIAGGLDESGVAALFEAGLEETPLVDPADDGFWF